MPDWFDRLTGKEKQNKGNKLGGSGGGAGGAGRNPFNLPPRKFQGAGQSLGGSKPGRVVQVSLSEQGPFGCKVERRPNSERSAIVSMVVPGGQAERAGLQRGDILCFPDSNGEDEISFDEFLQIAKSDLRPISFDVRRIETKTAGSEKSRSAEAYARKQAVIAAAEAREKDAKKKQKPMARSGERLRDTAPQPKVYDNEFSEVPMSDEARRAVEAAKQSESNLARQLGYNPYETNKSTAGQARNATVSVQHGAFQGGAGAGAGGTGGSASIPVVAPPKAPTTAAKEPSAVVSQTFEDAYTITVTSNDNAAVISSFGIMRKLMVNATTKGQNLADESSAKFRKVRLTNAKIKAAITDVHGALDMMMAVGFQLTEDNKESYLVFPAGHQGPPWLSTALLQMERYEKS